MRAPSSFPFRIGNLLAPYRSSSSLAAALAAAVTLSMGCSGSGPDLDCPQGLQAVWVDQMAGVGECQAPLPRVDPNNGLLTAFPDMVRPAGSLNTPDRIELGRLLFFDPILSGDNSISCANCHHPDHGFTDNRQLSIGIHGQHTGRSAPSVWNAAFYKEQFWDGRAPNLEEQAKGPIQNPGEMGETVDNLLKELKAIPEYVDRFDRAFYGTGGSGLTFDNLAEAIATFERTIISANSPYDRFAQGDTTALSPAARHGLTLYRSVSTRCFECHGLPNFSNPEYKVIGVPDANNPKQLDPDIGRAKIMPGHEYEHAFKIPTLRNVALTAPYMHNGVFQTLDEVLDFYSKGGGPGQMFPIDNTDDKIRSFDLAPDEKADLIEFLKALTDESLKPAIPSKVPSGLPVLTHLS